MKIRMTLLAIATGVLLTTSYAAAENAQQDKMKTCNAEAKQKGLKGTDRQTFMNTCLSAGKAAATNPQQAKMTSCNKDATAKGLKGAERKAFMKTCLSAK
jgi:hypothetical protein